MAIVRLIEVSKSSNVIKNSNYTLREVYINPEHIVCLREDSHTLQLFQEGQLPDELDSRQRFTRVQLNRGSTGLDLVVVGSPEVVENKLRLGNRELLKG
jgi:hypothetical protein